MSSSRRPAGSEDSILASLERGSTVNAAQAQRSWLIVGGTAAAILTAMLAWIAYNNATSVRTLPVSEVRRSADAPEPVAARELPPAAPRQAAAIVEEPVPALVMLPPEQAGGAAKPAQQGAEIVEAPPEPVAVVAPSPKPAATRAPEREPVTVRPARAVAARPVPVKAAVVKTAAKKPKASAAPRPIHVPELDSDVALISAIVAHSSRHATERSEKEACKGKKCGSSGASSEPNEP